MHCNAETKAVVTAYERCVSSGDARGIAALRALIEVRTAAPLCGVFVKISFIQSLLQRRIDSLENFYVAHVDDERSVLFEKQRLKLRKLLHEAR